MCDSHYWILTCLISHIGLDFVNADDAESLEVWNMSVAGSLPSEIGSLSSLGEF